MVAAFPDRQFDRGITLNQVKEHQKLLSPGKERLGRMNDERWKGVEGLLVQYFALKPSARSAADYYTNEFVPAE